MIYQDMNTRMPVSILRLFLSLTALILVINFGQQAYGQTINVGVGATETFNVDTPASDINFLGSGTLDGTGAIQLSGQNIDVTGSANTAVINNVIENGASNTVVLNADGGSGALVLNGDNTFTGTLSVEGGSATAGHGNAFGAPGNILVVQFLSIPGAVADLGGFTMTKNQILINGGSGTEIRNGTLNVTFLSQIGRGEVSAVITGIGSLRKIGALTGVLSAVNTYTGTTTVETSTLRITSTGSINSSSAIIIESSNDTLDVDGGGNAAIGDTVPITNGGTFRLSGSDETIGSISGAGNISLQDNRLTTGNGSNQTVSGVVSGSGGLTKVGAGIFTLSGSNTYTGATTISAGTIEAANSAALGNNSTVTVAAAGTLNLSTGLTVGSLAGSGAVTLNANTLSAGGNDTSTSYSGVLSGTGALSKQGTGTTTLAGVNTYAGGTTVSGGILQGTTASLQGNIINNAALTFDQTTTGTYGGILSGTGSITKSNTGTVTLSGSNTYSGVTTINDGTLTLQGGSAIVDTGAVVVIGGALDVNSAETIGAVSGAAGTINLDADLTVGDATDTSYAGVIQGGNSLIKQGSSTLTLSGANTYSGDTTVSAGTLQVTGSLVSAVTVNANGTLGGTGSIGATTVNGTGTLAPGASAGTLSTGALLLSAPSVLAFELNTPGVVGGGVNDLIAVTGDITLDGILSITDLGGFGVGSYTLITYTGALTDNGLDLPVPPIGLNYSLSTGSNAVVLVVSAIPPQLATSLINRSSIKDIAFHLDVAPNFNDPDGQSLTFTSTGLPSGLSISTSGVISGTVGAEGNYDITVFATDPDGASVNDNFVLTVLNLDDVEIPDPGSQNPDPISQPELLSTTIFDPSTGLMTVECAEFRTNHADFQPNTEQEYPQLSLQFVLTEDSALALLHAEVIIERQATCSDLVEATVDSSQNILSIVYSSNNLTVIDEPETSFAVYTRMDVNTHPLYQTDNVFIFSNILAEEALAEPDDFIFDLEGFDTTQPIRLSDDNCELILPSSIDGSDILLKVDGVDYLIGASASSANLCDLPVGQYLSTPVVINAHYHTSSQPENIVSVILIRE